MFTNQRRHGAFTLIELLVVIAIISLLAAILFPVFGVARDKARAASCQSNMKQLGLGVQQYLQDNDEKLFFRASATANPTGTNSRVGATTGGNGQLWWNMLYPYVRTNGVYACPSDANPSPSADSTGATTLKRSYVAAASAEGLNLAQMTDASQELVISEKWGLDPTGTAITESWMEAFDGDMNPDLRGTGYAMAKFANRHQGGLECAFFDGHAKWLRPEAITGSQLISGCALVHAYPNKVSGAKMCDTTLAGCTQNGTWNLPYNNGSAATSPAPNLCNNPSWQANYQSP